MAYEIGTADGYLDLLERLKDFISDPARVIGDHADMTELVAIDDNVQSGESSQAWTIDSYTDVSEIELFAHGPGTSGVDEIYTWIDTYSSIGDDYYNWRMAAMTGYSSGVDISLQPGVTQGRLPRMLMWENPIPYWFLGNGRRYVVVAKISSVYECLYQGFALPYGLPTQFPYPMVVGGSACPSTAAANHRYSSVASDHRGFPNPYGDGDGVIVQGTFDVVAYEATLKVMQGTSWIKMQGRSGVTLYDDNNVWPYICQENIISYTPDGIFSNLLRENIDGSYPVFPLIPMMNNPNNHIFGELQGCFAVPGYGGLAAEDTLTINGETYIVFPIVANASRGDFWCIKKE